jgi:multidrug efflux pump subunit AcrA (membrane-fusion protein)
MNDEKKGALDFPEQESEPEIEETDDMFLHRSERRQFTDNRRAMLIAALLGLVAIAAIILGVRHFRKPAAEEATASEETQALVSVRVAKAERQPIAEQVSAVGTVFPRQEATVSPKISAPIASMPILKNRVVTAGDVLATLESHDLHAQRGEAAAALGEARANERSVITGAIPQNNAQDEKALRDARANVANARATYERRKVLYEQGGISKKDLEASQLALTTAENDLRLAEQTIALRAKALNPNDAAMAAAKRVQAEQHLSTLTAQASYAIIRAPITGVVTDQFQFQGDLAAPGTKMLTVADISEVIVKAPFADTVAAQLKVGDPATVLPNDSPDNEMAGKISLVSKATDPVNRTVEVWVNLANGAGRLKAGASARVSVSAKQKEDAIVVPASAVTLDASNANQGTVMVVDDSSVAHETKVTVGIKSADKIEITSGLQGGETVVVEGNYALPDGTKVEVTEGDKGDKEDKGDQGDKGGAGDEKKDEGEP